MNLYDTLTAKLNGRDVRTVGNNTRVRYVDDTCVAILLHHTEIVRAFDDGYFALDSGGWHTVTTKSRMNEYLPGGYRVYQQDFAWSLRTPDGDVPFHDGMVLRDPDYHQDAAAA